MILVTGGAGYIGSHTVLSLLASDYDVVVLDNLSNGHFESIKRVEYIQGKTVICYEGDIADELLLNRVFTENTISAVIHFAALKAVGVSVKEPLAYYQNNVQGTLTFLLNSVMREEGTTGHQLDKVRNVYVLCGG